MLSTRTRSKRKATSENPEDKVQISTERTTNGSAEDKNQDTDVDREMAVDLDSLESFSTEPNSLISDQYFLCQSSKSKTTKTVFSTVLGDFNLNEIQISDIIHRDYDSLSAELDVKKNIESMFRKCYHMLRSKFNIIFYGYGSKRQILNDFAQTHLDSHHHYVVIKGYSLEITLKHIIYILNRSIANSEDVVYDDGSLFEALREYYHKTPLYLVIHSIDTLCHKNVKIQNFLLNLVTNVPQVRILTSVDHVNAPLMWSLTESSIFQWIWFPLNTYEPYSIERKFSTGLSMISSTSKSWKQSINLSSVQHVYESLNSNAQKIFLLLLKQYVNYSKQQASIPFSELYLTCREEFLVNSEITLRAQLSEFKDHSLLNIRKGPDGSEAITLGIDKSIASKFIESIEGNP